MQETAVDREAWIRRYHPAPAGGVRLVTLPHAGGAATYFHPLSQALSGGAGGAGGIEVLSVQYPGRQDRRHEPAVESIDRLAEQITATLEPWTGEPLALFGHSMGATVGFEVARRLERAGTPPVAFFASGRPAPGLERRDRLVHLLDDEGLLTELQRLSGTDPRIFQDDELIRLTLPAIRSDYRAVETYVCEQEAVLDTPVTVLIGDSDPRVGIEDARAWQHRTRGGIDLHVFSGGHFYLADHQPAIAGLIRTVLTPALA